VESPLARLDDSHESCRELVVVVTTKVSDTL